jgi:hypothetical protein
LSVFHILVLRNTSVDLCDITRVFSPTNRVFSHVYDYITSDNVSMWQHCNAALHNEGTTIHKYEMKALDMEIREEILIGLDGLDRKYSHLFEGLVQSKLDDKMMKKRMWIMNV